MLKTIRRAFRPARSPISDGTHIVINTESLERRVALVENGSLEEYSIERTEDDNIVGSIFKGRVKNIEQGLKAMFVDIGMEKNAFLHFWDAIPAALDGGLEEINRGGKNKKKITSGDIPSIYPVGSEVMIQVTKGPISTKGPRVTTNVSLPGRYLVLMPLNEQFGISRKVDDPKERKRLRKILERLSIPEGMGVIMRTVAQGKRVRHFVRDLSLLLEQWAMICDSRDSGRAPVRCFDEPDLVERTVRDFLTEEVGEVICDDKETVERMRGLISPISIRAKRRIQLYEDTRVPLFEKFAIQSQIDEAFFRQVWMPCGGYIVIDETEALISIDVNTGRNKGSKNVDKTILQTNLEAAECVARQLRLRNMGGLVVVDFIDMRNRKDQQAVYRKMRERMSRDRAKTQVLPISQLGLMEMTRQRLNESLGLSTLDACEHCEGKGRIKSLTTMSVEIQRTISAILQRHDTRNHDLNISINPEVMERLRTQDADHLAELQRKHHGRLTFRADPTFGREKFSITNAKSGDEVQ